MYYADPDGNQMEFQVDSYSSREGANAFISKYFSANPVGVEYDPEDWLARLRAGTPMSDFWCARFTNRCPRCGAR